MASNDIRNQKCKFVRRLKERGNTDNNTYALDLRIIDAYSNISSKVQISCFHKMLSL